MTIHKTRAREEWLAARLQLLQAEKELTRRSDELPRRQEFPWVQTEKEHRFETVERTGPSITTASVPATRWTQHPRSPSPNSRRLWRKQPVLSCETAFRSQSFGKMVGAPRFELGTSWSRTNP